MCLRRKWELQTVFFISSQSFHPQCAVSKGAQRSWSQEKLLLNQDPQENISNALAEVLK